MQRSRAWMLGLVAVALIGAAPATPSYIAIEKSIARVREAWAKPGAEHHAFEAGWNALFDEVNRELVAYTSAKSEGDRLRALQGLYKISVALDRITWPVAVEIREELRSWLRPRVALAWASRRLVDQVEGLPATDDPAKKENRADWLKIVDQDLGASLRAYEGANDVRARRAALAKVQGSINFLQDRNAKFGWGPSRELEAALADLYNTPNLQAKADPASVSARLQNYVVETGPIYRKGQVSYVTAGPFLGFGLLACDDGIMFYNSQALSSFTPIRGFQQQVASDPKGRRAAKLYHFDATSFDRGAMTVVAVLRPTGLELYPQGTHAVDAKVGATPQPGGGLGRAFASLLGMNRAKIAQKVYEGAIGQIRAQVPREAAEEAAERSAVRAAQTNAQLSNVFVGGKSLAIRDVLIEELKMRSRPQFVMVDGRVTWKGATDQAGAEMPKPTRFAAATPGVGADVHLPSIMTNLARGYLGTEEVRSIKNLLIVTSKVPPGGPAKDGLAVSQNVEFADFFKAMTTAVAANDPAVQAIRVKKPGVSPEFPGARNGNPVPITHHFASEVPAPPAMANAKVYRIEAPDAEIVISFKVLPAEPNQPVRLNGRVEGFDAGPGAKVFTINDDEAKATQLSALSARLVFAGVGAKLRGRPIDVPLGDLNLPGFRLSTVSDVDPTGWMRIVLTPTGQ